MSLDLIAINKLLDACINGKGNIFDEFRKIRNVKRDFAKKLDGSNHIPDNFANIYNKLSNSKQDKDETLNKLGNVNTTIDIRSLIDVNLVNSDTVRKATEQVKSNKDDPVLTFNYDSIKQERPRPYL